LQTELPKSKSVSATEIISNLRMRKSVDEIESLRQAGIAIDKVHSQVSQLLRVGRTEAEVGSDIAKLIIESGHAQVDFVIVGSGPNSASPHHEVSDRVIQIGDVVVVDIGGTMPDGYCSDSTRTYSMGPAADEFKQKFEVLHIAQQLATKAVRPGVSCESIDQVARDYMNEKGIGEFFIHRIGHGIGMETHEDPYMVTGNKTLLEVGMAFSIEPGFYLEGQSGARIEDIVICGETGADVLNNRPRELIEIEV
jgi:Xaa-Pro aminopeptidase